MLFDSLKVSSFLKRAAVVAVGLAAVFAAGGARAAVKSSYDYVQDGLIAHWDGVENVSRLVHVSETNVWKDLVSGREFSLTGVTIGDACLTFAGNSTGSFGKLSAADTDQTFELAKNGTLEIVVQHASKNTAIALQSTSDSGHCYSLWNSKAILSSYSSPMIQNVDYYSTTNLITVLYNNGRATSAYLNGEAQTLGGSDSWGTQGDETWIGRRASGQDNPFKGSIYAIRLYSRKLTAAEIAANASVDTARFVNGEYADRGFVIRGEPDGIGESTPAYGMVDSAEGATTTCRALSAWTNAEENVRADCLGWRFSQMNGTVTSGSETQKDVTYTSDMLGAVLTWRWNVQYVVRSADEVTVSPKWVTSGSTVTLTATPPEGKVLSHWTNAVSGVYLFGNPLKMTVTEPITILPVFSTPCYVTTDGNDDTGSGTASAPYASIAKALSVAEPYDVVIVSNGTYSISSSISIASPVTVRGFSGDPKDVTLNVSAAVRHFTLNHAEARLESLTMNGGGVKNRGGVSIESAGGCVVNCVLVGNRGANTGGAVYMKSSSGFFDRCVFSNNVAVAGDTYGHAVQMTSGILRNCLIVNNGSEANHYGYGGSVYATGGRIENCSFYGNKDYFLPGVRAKSTTVVNSILGKGTGPQVGKASDAYFYKDSGAVFATNICPVAISGGVGCIVSDRLFRNAAANDYLPGDDAQDVANMFDWMTDAVDVAGTNRVMGIRPDLGCCETPITFAKVTYSAVEGHSPLSVEFKVTLLGPCPQGVECEWDWNGDGMPDATTSGTTTHAFPSGSYNVRVKVKDVATGTVYEPPTPMPVKSAPSILHVAPTAAHSAFPYDTWDNAATNLADAIAAAVGGCEVIVSNGTYTLGDMLKIDKGVTVRGLSGNPKDVVMKVSGSWRHFGLDHASVALKEMTIDGSSVKSRGGVVVYAGGGSVIDCVLIGNRGAQAGGAVYMKSSSGFFDRCVFSNNVAVAGDTNGHAVQMASGILRNCLIVNNGSEANHYGYGGSVYATGGRIENCSFYGNKDYFLPGVRAKSTTVVNSILGKGTGPEISKASNAYFCNDGGAVFATNVCPVAISGGVGCIESDKLYLDAENQNFMPGDGALDAAAVLSWMSGTVDLAGKNRIAGDKPDIGCYEMPVSFVKVSADVSEGLSPVTVTYTVKVNGAECPDGVRCEWDWNGDGKDIDISYGTTNHTFAAGNYNVRVKVTNIGTGEIYEPSVPFALTSVPPVLYVAPAAAHSGYPYDSWDKAATNLADAVALAISGCEVIVSNGTYTLGAMLKIDKGVTVRGMSGNPKDVVMKVSGSWRHFGLDHASVALRAMSIDGSSVTSRGGVVVYAGGGNVIDCVLVGNRGAQAGGAVYMKSSSGFFDRCVFSNNVAVAGDTNGHAVQMASGILRNCLIVNNGSTDSNYGYGGAVYATGGRIENCSFYGNKDCRVPGVRVKSTTVVNSILGKGTGPEISKASNAYFCNDGGSVFVTNVCPVAISGGVGCIESDKIFKDAEKGRFQPGEDAKNAAHYMDWMATSTDLSGRPRVFGKKPDLGCYECQIGGFTLIVR